MLNETLNYETFREIMGDLLEPISTEGLDLLTLRNLYQSKLRYIEELRVYCFHSVNTNPANSFTKEDYVFILEASKRTRNHLKILIKDRLHKVLAEI